MEQRHEPRSDGVAQYEVTGNPHPIQARKAWEDNDTWMAGTLLAFEDGVATVAFGDQEELALETGLRIGGPVWVTERWSVLAFADEDGNAIAIRPLEELSNSIFTLIGHGRLRFVTIQLAEESQEEPEEELEEFVYGVVTGLDGIDRFFIVPEDTAEDTAHAIDVVNSCSTWGEIREEASHEQYEELLVGAGFDEEDPPGDGDPFDPNDIDGLQSVEYPMTHETAHELYLPIDLRQEFGKLEQRFLEGSVWTIPVENGPRLVAELKRRGHRCTENVAVLAAEQHRFEWMT